MINKTIFFFLLLFTFNFKIVFANEAYDGCGYLDVGHLDNHYGTIFVEEKSYKHYLLSYDEHDSNYHNFKYNHVCLSGNITDNKLTVMTVKKDESKVRKNVQSDNNCQLFIDKIGVRKQTSRFTFKSYQVFLKVNLDQLDGNIVRVGAFTKESFESGGISNWNVTGRLATVASFAQSTDYFVISTSFAHTKELVFFVETENATRYWAKAKLDGNLTNFKFHEHTYDYLSKLFGFAWTVSDLTKTADFNTYFNPFACR